MRTFLFHFIIKAYFTKKIGQLSLRSKLFPIAYDISKLLNGFCVVCLVICPSHIQGVFMW